MKSRRRSLLRSALASHRRIGRNGSRTLSESKGVVCTPSQDTVASPSPEPRQPGGTALVPVKGIGENVATRLPSNAVDAGKLLHFSQQLYAHALTLQEVIRNEGAVAYEVLRPRYDRQAAKQFEIFYRTGDAPTAKGRPVELESAAMVDR